MASLENTSPHGPLLLYIYWDHSNLFIEAQHMADRIDREEFGDDAAYRVRINFHNMMELACENRKVAKAVAAGSVPPEMKMVWKKMEEEGIRTEIIDRNGYEKDLPDLWEMLLDGMNHQKTPGTVVLLTGDGAGWAYGKGFLTSLQGMKKGGWNIEVISWSQSCNRWLKEWVVRNGHFTSLDTFYRSVTFLVPSENRPEWRGRPSSPLELWRKRASPFAKRPEDN